jgi:hypothetical protein
MTRWKHTHLTGEQAGRRSGIDALGWQLQAEQQVIRGTHLGRPNLEQTFSRMFR